jgi:hypothetical protein
LAVEGFLCKLLGLFELRVLELILILILHTDILLFLVDLNVIANQHNTGE